MGFRVILCMPSNWRRHSGGCYSMLSSAYGTYPGRKRGHLCSSSGTCQHVLHYRRYPSWLNMGDRCDRGSLAKQSLCLLAPRQTRVDKGEQGMCRALAQPTHLSERGVMTGKHQS
ncbi:hypothetical protein ASA_2065 [Aeromonas salmonicida subsp. salmonicida A449]|uniref:Uncharacterized protein n=1 Tax=Aeromonas salmonicida (strain A449) TaxID=382245 RepID=A4SML0_AERS4|nr:hypothetical protein ASA_2065 [Aeromonas salmonicida subsp. salmonicida A449]